MKKTLKAQLFSAIAMMLVAAVALGTSTYAWFVNNAAPEVATMEFTATTSTALQIAVNKATTAIGTHGDWKGTITNTDITAQGTCGNETYATFFSNPMVPATVTDENIVTLRAAVPTSFFTNDEDSLNSETFKFEKFEALTDFANEVKMVPLYFLANQDMDVYLKTAATSGKDIITAKTAVATSVLNTAAEKAIANETNGSSGSLTEDGIAALQAVYDAEFTKIQDAVRVAFVVDNNPLGETDTSKITHLIYEPSADTDNVGSRRDTTEFGEATGTGTTIATINTDNTPATKGAQTTVTALTDNTITTDESVITADQKATVTSGKTALFSLTKDVDKQVKVYIWLEGTDYDCVGEIAELPFAVNLAFIGVAK